MNREPDPDETMRAEYDFRGGARGRFAALMTARERRQLYESAAAADLKTWWTDALHQLQKLEGELFAYLSLVLRLPPEEASARAVRCVEGGELGGSPSAHLPGDFPQRFSALMRERAWLVHRSGIEGESASRSLEASARITDRFQRITEEAIAMTRALADAVERSLAGQGLAPAEIERRTGEAEAWWRAA